MLLGQNLWPNKRTPITIALHLQIGKVKPHKNLTSLREPSSDPLNRGWVKPRIGVSEVGHEGL